MVKSLKKDEELETTNSDKSRNELETSDSVEWFDSHEPNYMMVKRTGRQPKPTPKQRV